MLKFKKYSKTSSDLFWFVDSNGKHLPKEFLAIYLKSVSSWRKPTMEPERNDFAILFYIRGTSEVIKRALAKHNVKTALKPFQTLFQLFPKPKEKFGTQQIKRSDILYSI